ncbi:MAG: TIGR01777 family oxidoreductase [Bacteroidetes bacterium]|nr:TIGR01777 family oxidoreductase [Bacteroidota bacterium]
MKYNKIILAGGNGYLGTVLANYYKPLVKEIIILARHPKIADGNIKTLVWDGETEGEWVNELEGADLLVNLCGKNVNCRYTAKNKRKIFDSRLKPTSLLNRVVAKLIRPPKLWINSASATIYRHAEDGPQDEVHGEIGDGFSVEVCKAWEKTFFEIEMPHTRKVTLRTGIVFGKSDGVFPRLLNLVKMGLGGRQGNGKQMVSWIHEQDVARITEWLTDHPEIEGTVNATAPNPVSNALQMKLMREAYGARTGLPMPKWLLSIGALIIGTETELILKSRWVIPKKLLNGGYQFKYPVMKEAVKECMTGKEHRAKRFTAILASILIPLLFGLIMRELFDINSWRSFYQVMSVSFLFLVPFAIGVITIYFSNVRDVERLGYRICMPWVTVCGLLFLTILLRIEGWACWLMALPVFLVSASIGGLVAGHFKLKKHRNERGLVSLLVLLPFFASPIEQAVGSIPGKYEAYTYIDIRSDRAKIWDNVTRVKTIRKEQDKGWLTQTIGFPRPIRAELNYNGVGAYRKAIFSKGLVFHESVGSYLDGHSMHFSIKAYPYEIPSTTMDKHVVIGGNYFDVLDGTYVLQKISANTYRLHLYSHFKLTTTFNFYASWWAGWIMQDIQNNILQVIKQRAEG